MFSQAGSRLLAAGLIFRQMCPVLSLSQSGKAGRWFIRRDTDGASYGDHFKHKQTHNCVIMQ